MNAIMLRRRTVALAGTSALVTSSLLAAPALAMGSDWGGSGGTGCDQAALTGTTLWNAGDNDITERHKTSDVTLGEVNADGWGNMLRLYGATNRAYDAGDVTVTITGGTFDGTFNTISTPGAGKLQANGYTAAVGSVTVTSVSPTTVTLHLDGLAPMSSWSVNVAFTRDASQGDVTLTETEAAVTYVGSALCPATPTPTPTEEPTTPAATEPAATATTPIDDTTGAGPDPAPTTPTQEAPAWSTPSSRPSASSPSSSPSSSSPAPSSSSSSTPLSAATTAASTTSSKPSSMTTPHTTSASSPTPTTSILTATTDRSLAHTGMSIWLPLSAFLLLVAGLAVVAANGRGDKDNR